jgi:pilus assembly protein CpaE
VHRPTGVYLLDSPRRLEQMVAVDDEGMTQVLLAMRNAFKYVIVDTVPVLTPVMLSIGDLSEFIIVVTEALVPAVKGTRALLNLLQEAGYNMSRVRIVLNRFSRFSGNIEPHLAAQSLGRPIDYLFPYDKRLHESANVGVPFLTRYADSVFGQGIDRLSREVGELPPAPARRPMFKRLLSFGGR